jgi:hypothetical protein
MPPPPSPFNTDPKTRIAYEWNYHRTGRLLLHTHLLECISRLLDSTSLASNTYSSFLPPSTTSPSLAELQEYHTRSLITINVLAGDILSTVPQSLGDISSSGELLSLPKGMDEEMGEVLEDKRTLQGVGAYFLLWPIKILKSHEFVDEELREMARGVFERIREVTGMRDGLGEKSCI